MKYREILSRLKSLANPDNVAGMARYGINAKNTLGISIPNLRQIAKEIGWNHDLALRLWSSKIHEARILASLIDDPAQVTEEQMEKWAKDFDSWDVCDLCCGNLLDKTPLAWQKALEWPARPEEFVKRAGFTLMAALAVHDKQAADQKFLKFLPHITKESRDERNFVKKAVNWALRQIGKRNFSLNIKAIQAAKRIKKLDSRSSRWIAADALRELTGPAVQKKLRPTAELNRGELGRRVPAKNG
jgi:3-methyladenine DNA glycosylase AlkD